MFPLRILLTAGLALPLVLAAQNTPNAKLFERGMVSSSFISGQTALQSNTTGSPYYDDRWNKGMIELENGQIIRNVPIRYDLSKSIVEYRQDGSVEGYSTELVSSFSWYSFTIADSVHFVTRKESLEPFNKVYEVIVNGQMKLYSKIDLKIQEPNYLPNLDLGNPDKKIIRKENYYIAEGSEITPVNRKIQDNLIFFAPYENELYQFAKEFKIKCRKKTDLIYLISYFNQLKRAEQLPPEENFNLSAANNLR
ncbi:MAG: hypothetical protein ACFHWX_22450 [Bacteroidota bacterium]